jgi:arylsulfatase A-like enzyme
MHSPIHAVDWMPTIATLVGYEPGAETGWDGRSNWKELDSGGEINEERSLYWLWGMGRNNERAALRHGDWKIVRMGADADWELFNLEDDPNETTDLAEKNPEKLKELLGYLEEEQSKDRREG